MTSVPAGTGTGIGTKAGTGTNEFNQWRRQGKTGERPLPLETQENFEGWDQAIGNPGKLGKPWKKPYLIFKILIFKNLIITF